MKTLITILLCLLALNDFSAPVPVVPIGLANPRFGIVSTMSSTDYVAIEIAGRPHGIALANLAGSVTNGSIVTIAILNVTSNVLVTIINATNTALIADINAVSNYLYGLISTNVTVAAGTNVIVGTNVVGNQTVYTVSSALDTNVIGTNTAGILASNNVRVAAGANVTVTPSASGGVMTYTVASAPTNDATKIAVQGGAGNANTFTNSIIASNLAWTLVSIFPVSNGTNFQSDMAQAESLIQMTNNLFFQLSTNRTAGQVKYAAFQIEAGNTNWTLAFNPSWKWLGTTNNPPTTISSNKVAVLGLKCYGTSETNVVAAYAVQP